MATAEDVQTYLVEPGVLPPGHEPNAVLDGEQLDGEGRPQIQVKIVNPVTQEVTGQGWLTEAAADSLIARNYRWDQLPPDEQYPIGG